MYLQLRDLIRAVRCSKTAAEERNVIQKESAGIRTSLKETNSQDVRFNNIQKLLYIYLLGYPVKFGQLECLKLVASNKYSDKRLLQITLFFTLSDLQGADDYIVGLALCTLSALASEEVARDLSDDIYKLIYSSRSFIKKKAILAALRIIKKVPESIESFLPKARSLIGDKNHGVQIAATALLAEMCLSDTAAFEQVQKLVPIISRQLRVLISSASSDHDVSGVSDPFLQIGFLKLLRILGNGSSIVADEINDILTQIMSQTDDSKNVGTSVLYEAIKVVLAIPSEKSLRVLAINLLGKFLEHRDNNVRCIALKMLLEAMLTESASVLRVQSIIVQCLTDSDISIRHHALDLTFALINASNVDKLSTKLIEYLTSCDDEFKLTMSRKLFVVSEIFSSSNFSSILMKIKTLYLCGEYVSLNDMFLFIYNFCNDEKSNKELQRYFTRAIFSAIKNKKLNSKNADFNSSDKFIYVAAWVLGEFGDLAIDQTAQNVPNDDVFIITESERFDVEIPIIDDVIELLTELVHSKCSYSHIALTSLAKLTSRNLLLPSLKSIILSIFMHYSSSPIYELQSRSNQFLELLKESSKIDSAAILDKMPIPAYTPPIVSRDELNPAVIKVGDLSNLIAADYNTMDSNKELTLDFKQDSKEISNNATIFEDLLGLMDIQPKSTEKQTTNSNSFITNSNTDQASSKNLQGLMGLDVLNSSSTTNNDIKLNELQNSKIQTQTDLVYTLNNINEETSLPQNVSNHIETNTATIDQQPQSSLNNSDIGPEYETYFKNNVKIFMTPQKSSLSADILEILVKIINVGTETISGFNFQVAVPKTQRLQMMAPSGTELSLHCQEITQSIRIANPLKSPIRLRMRISYKSESNDNYLDITEFSSFDESVF
ncbi:hypothetical protein BB561_002018 [Smittium simulii]|uniref:AP-1 complex subunit gamma n=1 Tax=Smittium simulii TaxID=133385 RepID=A0A2T9YS12_9FUNG|nr:hypothetical protein BB561_002018 [Smittium simulii]